MKKMKKLSALAHARGLAAITPEEVAEVCSSTPECDTFALSNAILERNKRLALDALHEMRSRRLDPLIIMGQMSKTYSELLSVVMLLSDGQSQSEIESVTKINGKRLWFFVKAAKSFTPEGVSGIISELCRIDAASTLGGVNGYTAIELFILKYL